MKCGGCGIDDDGTLVLIEPAGRNRRITPRYLCKACMRRRRLKQSYGITPEEFDTQLEIQGGKCACCSKVMVVDVEKHLTADHAMVDHDHVTGKVRGIICHSCNTGIGRLGDNAEGVALAYRYLTEFKWHSQWIQDELDLFEESVTT